MIVPQRRYCRLRGTAFAKSWPLGWKISHGRRQRGLAASRAQEMRVPQSLFFPHTTQGPNLES
jgi:hypothetical protein